MGGNGRRLTCSNWRVAQGAGVLLNTKQIREFGGCQRAGGGRCPE